MTEEPAPAVITPPPAGATVVVMPAAAPYAASTPVWYGTPTADRVVMRRRNTGLMIGGLVMIPIGLAMAIGGGVLADRVNSETSECQASDHTLGGAIAGAVVCGIGAGIGRGMRLSLAYTFAISGAMMGAGGIAMAAVGGSKVPAKARWQPAVSVGAGSASLSWTF